MFWKLRDHYGGRWGGGCYYRKGYAWKQNPGWSLGARVRGPSLALGLLVWVLWWLSVLAWFCVWFLWFCVWFGMVLVGSVCCCFFCLCSFWWFSMCLCGLRWFSVSVSVWFIMILYMCERGMWFFASLVSYSWFSGLNLAVLTFLDIFLEHVFIIFHWFRLPESYAFICNALSTWHALWIRCRRVFAIMLYIPLWRRVFCVCLRSLRAQTHTPVHTTSHTER